MAETTPYGARLGLLFVISNLERGGVLAPEIATDARRFVDILAAAAMPADPAPDPRDATIERLRAYAEALRTDLVEIDCVLDDGDVDRAGEIAARHVWGTLDEDVAALDTTPAHAETHPFLPASGSQTAPDADGCELGPEGHPPPRP